MNETVKPIGYMHLSNVRFSYLYCFEPYQGKPDRQTGKIPPPLWKADLLMAPDHPDLKRVAATVEAVGAACKWKNGLTWEVVKESMKATDKLCLKRGDVSQPGDEAYKGLFFLKGSNKKRFTVLDGDKTPLTAADGRPYSGCYGNAIVDIWAQDNEFGRRINCTITGVQFTRKGDAFGGGAPAADPNEFGVVAASADEAPPAAAAADPLAGLV